MKKELADVLKAEKSLKRQLEALVARCPRSIVSVIRADREFGLRQRLFDACEKLRSGAYTDLTRVYWVLNGLDDFPECEVCGRPVENTNVRRLSAGYGMVFCCREHMFKARHARLEKANVEKYGAANPFSFMKDRIAETNAVRHGNACPANGPEGRRKARESCLKKYGSENYQSTDEFKRRIREASIEKYGVACPLMAEEVRRKSKETCLARYGSEDPMGSAVVRERIKAALIAKYGEDYGMVIWGGGGNAGQSRRAYGFMLGSSAVRPCFSEDEYVEARKNGVSDFEFECLNCGRRFLSGWDNGKPRKKCPYCQFNGGISGAENELLEFVSSVYAGRLKTNDRSVIAPLELDEYLEDMKLAIEFDGLYWHSDENKPARYHLEKTEACEKAGVRLIHVFESEWLYRKDIVKSRLKDVLGVFDRTVYARKCEVREVGRKEAREFQDASHIQGAVGAGVRLGLYFEGGLVALMTFGKCRFDRRHEWEMLRFCCRPGYHIPGAAGKLLKHFERTYAPKSLVSYADRRWSQGKLYEALGFRHVRNSPPNYWYFMRNSTMLESRVKYQKHRLAGLLPGFDPSKTEIENMRAAGYMRIFDCGNMVFEKVY